MSASSEKTSVLQVKNVKKVFDFDLLKKKEVVLNGISLDFHEKRCTGLLGHNGAGKTTTIRVIFGLITPDQGEVCYRGQPIKRQDFRNFGYMPEINKLAANLTPTESLHHSLNVYLGWAKKRRQRQDLVQSVLEKVGLKKHCNKRIGKLSKGLQRRLAWALATAHGPEVLILDEPFSGLDPLGRNQLSSWVEEEKFRGTSIILCTHELHAARQHCDDILILRLGEKVYDSASGEQNQAKQGQGMPYELTISGVQLSQLEELKEAKELPEWSNADQKEFLCSLSFPNYLDANQWMQAAISQGFLLSKFAECSPLANDDILLPYFDTSEAVK